MNTARDLADRFDLKRSRHGWRGNCPACGYAGTFSIREGRSDRPMLWCASCNDTAAIALAVSGAAAAPLPCHNPRTEAEAKARKQSRATAIWNGSGPVMNTPAALYLIARGLGFLAGSAALRYRVDTPHPEGGRYVALIALVSDATGAPMAVHRTYLRPNGTKANLDPVKASLGPVWGGAIRLSPLMRDRPVLIGEGIETAASAGHLMGLPAWAAISAGNLAKGLVLPPEARRVCIAADPDRPGREAARAAWLRWRAEGRDVTIATPTGEGDFNDVLICQGGRNGG